MKIIFLDIDGVLNSERSLIGLGGLPFPLEFGDRDWHLFDEVALGLLRHIVKHTGAKCVLSSSWRIGMQDAELKELAQRLGVPIIDKTKEGLACETRGFEIQDWLGRHEAKVQSFVILDDDCDMLDEQKPRFVHVDGNEGLSLGNTRDAIDILSRPLELEEVL